MSVIVPEGLFDTRSYEDCVKFMNENGSTLQSVTFTDYVFENAVTGSLIFVYKKGNMGYARKEYHMNENHIISESTPKDFTLYDKIRENKRKLKELATIFKGMVVSDRRNCVFEEKGERENKFLLGKNISKWSIDSTFYASYDKLKIIGGTKKLEKHNHSPRILIRRTGDMLCCAFLQEPALTESTLYSCWSNDPQRYSDKYLFALLNSRLLDFYNKGCNITNQQGFPQILMTDLEDLPIAFASKEQQDKIVALVDKILEAKRANPQADTSREEQAIDRIVYHLYSLTYDEVKTIDNATPITEEEYYKGI